VTSDTRQLLHLLAQDLRRGELASRVRSLDTRGFTELLDRVAGETRRLLELVDLVQGDAFESVLEQVLGAFASKVAEASQADRAALFLVDDQANELWSFAPGLGEAFREVRAPLDRGVVGLAARSRAPVRVPDVRREPHYDASLDAAGHGEPRSLLAVPLVDSHGAVFAVVELADKRGGEPFDAADEARLQDLTASLALVLESWWRMSCACRARGLRSTCPCCGNPWHAQR
jgi:adenylate cyclase